MYYPDELESANATNNLPQRAKQGENMIKTKESRKYLKNLQGC